MFLSQQVERNVIIITSNRMVSKGRHNFPSPLDEENLAP